MRDFLRRSHAQPPLPTHFSLATAAVVYKTITLNGVGLFSRFGAPFLILSSSLIFAADKPSAVDLLMEAGHWKQIARIASDRLRSNPKDAQAHSWLAKTRLSYNDPEGAVVEAEKAVAIDGGNPAYHSQLGEAYAMMADKSSSLKAVVFVHKMNRELDAALAGNPRQVEALLVQMMFCWQAPLLAGGNRQRALAIADNVVSFLPSWGYLAHARLLAGKGDDARLESYLLKAAQADPSMVRPRLWLAEFYCFQAQSKRLDLAETEARLALAIDPSAGQAYKVLAHVYATQKRWAELDHVLAQADSACSEDLSPYHSAAEALIEIGQDFNRAESYLQKYLTQQPEGRQPTHAQAHWLLADLYKREGRKSDAMRELHAALRLQPDFTRAKQDLTQLSRS
jgi:tetratricopeptide (TPR) repeat protein